MYELGTRGKRGTKPSQIQMSTSAGHKLYSECRKAVTLFYNVLGAGPLAIRDLTKLKSKDADTQRKIITDTEAEARSESFP